MSRSFCTSLTTTLALGLIACSPGAAKNLPAGDTSALVLAGNVGGTDTAILRDGAAPRHRDVPRRTAPDHGAYSERNTVSSGSTAPATRTLPSGARVQATIEDSLSSRTNSAGESVTAYVTTDVLDAAGGMVVPSASPVVLTIEHLDPGSDQVQPGGRLSLIVTSVRVGGKTYPLSATLEPVPHTMVGRGVGKDEAERVAVGTAVGAIAGRLIGKDTKGTVVGGVVGAAAGTAVAVRYAYHDVVVAAGTPIVFTLTQPLTVLAR